MESRNTLAVERLTVPRGDYRFVLCGMHHVWRNYLRVFRPGKFNKFKEQRYRTMADNHSCRPFDQHRCIFVHIPKCAGISVSRSLFGNVSGAHHSLRKFQIMFAPGEFAEYFKFTFVRNPWDRLVSAFHFLKKGGLTEQDKAWSERYLAQYPDFDAFVRNGLHTHRIFSFPHFRPQYTYICLLGKQPAMNFIGHFENLEDDFSHVCRTLKLDTALMSLNRNGNREQDFRKYYTDETRGIVGRLYAEDIRILGYTFDGTGPGKTPSDREV
jgi:hypothetical protein